MILKRKQTDEPVREKRFSKVQIAIIVTVLTATVVIASATATFAYGKMTYERYQESYASYLKIAEDDDVNRKTFVQNVEKAHEFLSAVTEESVDDVSLIAKMSEHLKKADELIKDKPEKLNVDPEDIETWLTGFDTLSASADVMKTDINDVQGIDADLKKDMEDIKASQTRKEISIAREELKTSIDAGDAKHAQSAGKVADDATRSALASALEAGRTAFDDENANAQSLRDAKATIDVAITSVDKSIEVETALNTPWYVVYHNDYGTAEAAADGSCTQWADRYFIAHSWSANGKRIASKPRYVVVDGVKYKYVSSMVVSRDSYFSEIEGFARANGGITFQTCVPNGYLVVHYEPV